jgi:hypothetical protein
MRAALIIILSLVVAVWFINVWAGVLMAVFLGFLFSSGREKTMRCVMCEEVGADCTLHGPAANERDATLKLEHLRLENEVLRSMVKALQVQFKAARRLVDENAFRRFFAEVDEVTLEGEKDLREAATDEQIANGPCKAFAIPIAMGYGRFHEIHNICRTALMDRGSMED